MSDSDIDVDENNNSNNNKVSATWKSNINPETVAILSVYFVQGILGLSRLAVSFYLKDDLHLSPADMAAIMGVTSIPWIVKPVYGFISDGIPLFGYKRRSYLIISGLIGCLSWVYLGTIASSTISTTLAISLASASIAFSDVVVDSIVVERSRKALPGIIDLNENEETTQSMLVSQPQVKSDESTSGVLQSQCWGAAALGGILSAYFSGSLLQMVSPQQVFLYTSIFPLIISLASLFIDEVKVESEYSFTEFRENATSQLNLLKDTLFQKNIYLPVLFIFLWQATPSADSAMFYFYTNDLSFTPEFLGKVRLVASVASLIGVGIYRTWLKDVDIKNVIFYATIISVLLSLTQLILISHYNRMIGIPDQYFVLSDTVVLAAIGQMTFMPLLVLAASLCPPGIEGTLFAALMSIYNFSGTISAEGGALLTSLFGVTDKSFDNLSLLLFICSISSLLPLPFINVLDRRNDKSVDDVDIDTMLMTSDTKESTQI